MLILLYGKLVGEEGGELNRRKSQHQQKPVAQCVENEENNKSSYVTITYLVDQLTKLGFSGKLH